MKVDLATIHVALRTLLLVETCVARLSTSFRRETAQCGREDARDWREDALRTSLRDTHQRWFASIFNRQGPAGTNGASCLEERSLSTPSAVEAPTARAFFFGGRWNRVVGAFQAGTQIVVGVHQFAPRLTFGAIQPLAGRFFFGRAHNGAGFDALREALPVLLSQINGDFHAPLFRGRGWLCKRGFRRLNWRGRRNRSGFWLALRFSFDWNGRDGLLFGRVRFIK